MLICNHASTAWPADCLTKLIACLAARLPGCLSAGWPVGRLCLCVCWLAGWPLGHMAGSRKRTWGFLKRTLNVLKRNWAGP